MLNAGETKLGTLEDLHGLVLSHKHEIPVLQPMPVVVMVLP